MLNVCKNVINILTLDSCASLFHTTTVGARNFWFKYKAENLNAFM